MNYFSLNFHGRKDKTRHIHLKSDVILIFYNGFTIYFSKWSLKISKKKNDSVEQSVFPQHHVVLCKIS